jgi:choline transport protein
MPEDKCLDSYPLGYVAGILADHNDNAWEHNAVEAPKGQLDKYISLKPMVAFGLCLQGSWESIAISFQGSLLNEGPVSLVYGIMLTAMGSSAIALSLGEMASM